MGRKRIIYFGLLLIVAVLVIVTSFSYAFLIKTEEHHGKLNIVTGTLDYKLSSKLLNDNNQIVLSSNEKAKLNIKIESLNGIDSKYELFYTTTNNSVEIGYTTLGDTPTGTIAANKSKSVNVVIKNTSDSSATITFGIIGGFTGNTLVKETGTSLVAYNGTYCEIAANTAYNYDYTGSPQEFDVPCNGNYKVELWGAQGGNYTTTYVGGYGAYTAGNLTLQKNDNLKIYVGSQSTGIAGGYNGGGNGYAYENYGAGNGGGGATDVRYNGTSLNDRIMVAGAGGGISYYDYDGYLIGTDGNAGGINGNNGSFTIARAASGTWYNTTTSAMGGTQTEGGKGGRANVNTTDPTYYGGSGSFGQGGNGRGAGTSSSGAGGGAGYYGGGGTGRNGFAGGGGSSYISGHTGCVGVISSSNSTPKTGCTTGSNNNECSKHYSNLVFTDTKMIDGSGYSWTNIKGSLEQMPNPAGGNYASGVGHSGNGYARITYLGDSTEEIKESIGYVVTFNANGGTVGVPNKIVSKNSTYGTLPTPTRSGYTFKGWNGKNMFNYQEVIKNSLATIVTLDGVSAMSWVNSNTGENLPFLTSFKTQTQYTLSGRIASNSANLAWIALNYSDNSYGGSLDAFVPTANTFYNFTLTTKANATLVRIGGIWHSSERMYIDINNFQIEEGTTATPYEPYYITSSTNVVQNKNHTLTAIWEAN